MKPAANRKFPGIRLGVIGGVSLVLLSLIGIVEAFSQREIISDVISMGQCLLLFIAVFIAYVAAARSISRGIGQTLAAGLTSALVMAVMLTLLILLGTTVNMRQVLINASPRLFMILTFGQESLGTGIGFIFLTFALIGLGATALRLLPETVRRAVITGAASIAVIGMLQDMIYPILAAWEPIAALNDLLFPGNGLSISGALSIFVIIAAFTGAWARKGEAVRGRISALPPGNRRALRIGSTLLAAFVLMVLPHVLGLFLSEVLTIVGLYVLLGLGLNIVVGFAGLLDLGYVAFFAIGSYTVAILTSPELGFYSLNFWQALPFAILFGILAGVFLGVPVLR